MSLILEKITKIKASTHAQIKNDTKKLTTIKSINELLNQIDFTVEDVPIRSTDKLSKLLISLKGDKLSKNETELVTEITEK